MAVNCGLAAWKEEYPEVYAKTIQGIPMGCPATPNRHRRHVRVPGKSQRQVHL
ncbi:MAG: hypothetical protein KHY83_03430 [Coriobacteriia bacterium]|nr:hypothetical protein [Coriobacteriia bacterium]MBS5477701.1 hypothetical protein [Coriobacteriia bacterium]